MDQRDMGIFDKISQGYSNLWKLLIKPDRVDYSMFNLGPPMRYIGSKFYKRHDYQIVNQKGHLLECSYFEPVRVDKADNSSNSTGLGNSDCLVQNESLTNDSSE